MLAKALIFSLALASSAFSAKTCVVPSNGNVNISDTPAILSAFKTCGNKGTIIFKQNTTYSLGELTVLTGCKGCKVELDGTIRLSDNLEYWNSSTSTTLKFAFQDTIAAFVIKDWENGVISSPKRTGVIDGAGQRWWNAFAGQEALDPGSLRRPVLFTIWQSKSVKISNIHFKDSPNWNNFVTDSEDIEFRNVLVTAKSINKNPPKNSDGWDTYRSSRVRILDSHVVVGDDCFSFKPNSTDITIKNIYCEGTHGVSVGSLAQYKGELDIVRGAIVQNITFVGGTNAFRIKTWAGDRGSAIVENITYTDLKVNGVAEAITLDACYFNLSEAECTQYPSKVNIKNVKVNNLSGTTTKSKVASLRCAEGATCDVKFTNVDLKPQDGSQAVYSCTGLTSSIGIPCS